MNEGGQKDSAIQRQVLLFLFRQFCVFKKRRIRNSVSLLFCNAVRVSSPDSRVIHPVIDAQFISFLDGFISSINKDLAL